MSDLLSPEASHLISISVYLTRKRDSCDKIILFSGKPNFKGSCEGTNHLWLNSFVYRARLATSAIINL